MSEVQLGFARPEERERQRASLLWAPAAGLSLVAVLLAFCMALETAIDTWQTGTRSEAVLMLPLTWATALPAFGFVMAIAWALWAPIAAGLAALSAASRGRRLAVAPLARPAPPSRFLVYARRASELWSRKRWYVLATVLVAFLAGALAADLTGPEPFRARERLVANLLFLVVNVLVVTIAVAIARFGLRRVIPNIESLLTRPRALVRGIAPALLRDRHHAVGTARALDETVLRAPLSGRACLGYRLRGSIGRYAIDDAVVTSFVIEDARAVVRGERHALCIERPRVTCSKLTSEQAERLQPLLQQLGIEIGDAEISLGESLLCDGERVSVHAALADSAPLAGDGYRSQQHRIVLDDSDRRAVLIQRASRSPT